METFPDAVSLMSLVGTKTAPGGMVPSFGAPRKKSSLTASPFQSQRDQEACLPAYRVQSCKCREVPAPQPTVQRVHLQHPPLVLRPPQPPAPD